MTLFRCGGHGQHPMHEPIDRLLPQLGPILCFLATASLALSLSLSVSCRSSDSGTSSSSFDARAPNDEPRTDLVPSVGTDDTFEIATWNVENFPKRASTPSVLADLIASLDLDVLVLQEVQDSEAFTELVDRLPGHDGILSSHAYGDGTYQKVGFVYRSKMVSLEGAFLLFRESGYEFPRPPLKVDVTVDTGGGQLAFTAIGVHLKAGFGGEDRLRRTLAVEILEEHVRQNVEGAGNPNIIVIGDFNDTLRDGQEVFAPFASTGQYSIRTESATDDDEFSFVPTRVILDHIVTSTSFDAATAQATTIIPRLDLQLADYEGQVSDHLPVITRFPL